MKNHGKWWSSTHHDSPQCWLLSRLGRTKILNAIIFDDDDDDDHRDYDDKYDDKDDNGDHLEMEVLGKELALAEPAEAAVQKYSIIIKPFEHFWNLENHFDLFHVHLF